MNRILKIVSINIVLLLLAFGFSMAVLAAPYFGSNYELKQPDGSLVKVKIYGDEFYQRVESIDGYTLVRDPATNWICYAKMNADSSDFESTGIVYQASSLTGQGPAVINSATINLPKGLKLKVEHVRKKSREMRKSLKWDEFLKRGQKQMVNAAPSDVIGSDSNPLAIVQSSSVAGSFVGLTILIDFPDVQATIPKDNIDAMINQIGYTGYGNNGSVHDYFAYYSEGKLDYHNTVTAYYTAKYKMSYYDDPNVQYGQRAIELVTEALRYLESTGFDFSTLSVGTDGQVKALNIMYAGSPQWGWSKGLWPHSSSIPVFYTSGVNLSRYQMTNIESDLAVGVFVHENCHMILGWPDTYDYGGESAGTGSYDIMSSRCDKNPIPPNPYFRNVLAGWGTVTQINNYPDMTTITLSSNSVNSFIFQSKSPNEFFMIESVSQSGRWAGMPDQGLLIWHIDTNGDNNDQQMTAEFHYLVSVEQADGLFDLEKGINGGNQGDLFHDGYKNRFDYSTNPRSALWNKNNSNLYILDIGPVGSTMTFKVRSMAPLFSDSFDNPDLDTSKWLNIGAEIVETPIDKYSVKLTDSDSLTTINLNTLGYQSLQLSYSRYTTGDCGLDEPFFCEWIDEVSTTWKNIEKFYGYMPGIGYTFRNQVSFMLPLEAENKANIKIRFRTALKSGLNHYAMVDDVKVLGLPIIMDVNPPSSPSNLAVLTKTATTVRLSWEAATDDVGITGYDVYNGSHQNKYHWSRNY